MLTIANVLKEIEISALREHLNSQNSAFEDGRRTAGWQAQNVKNNEQLPVDIAKAALEKVRLTLLNNPVFVAAARPKTFVNMLVSRYKPGMEYGLHIDDAVMGGVRTDLSFTLFLSEPYTYDGGALIIEDNDGSVEIKPEAGSLFLYATKSLHRVEPVSRGERLAIVCWVRSFIRSDDQRDVLFELDQAVAEERARGDEAASLNRLLKIRNNLLRMWTDD